MNKIIGEISIPVDNDGYVLLQCTYCGCFFKITPSDYNDEGILDIHCPSCGLVGDSYITEDVLELARVMIENVVSDMIYNEMEKWEKSFKNKFMSFKAGKKPTHKNENPIYSGIEALSITEFNCCKRYAKIKPMLKISGCVCPFCGVKNYELE